MAGLLYFVPGSAAPIAERTLREIGLGHALGGRGVTSAGVRSGPGGTDGALVAVDPADANRAAPCLYAPTVQTWRAGPANADRSPSWYVGYCNASPPEPADLAREKPIAGEPVRLLDGRDWTVPIARSLVRGSTLPKRLVLGPDCQTYALAELPEFVAICGEAERIWTLIQETRELRLEWAEAVRIAVAALAVNYRIGPVEADLLGLFSTENVFEVLLALVDWPAVVAEMAARQKKSTAGDGSCASGGSEGDLSGISRALRI